MSLNITVNLQNQGLDELRSYVRKSTAEILNACKRIRMSPQELDKIVDTVSAALRIEPADIKRQTRAPLPLALTREQLGEHMMSLEEILEDAYRIADMADNDQEHEQETIASTRKLLKWINAVAVYHPDVLEAICVYYSYMVGRGGSKSFNVYSDIDVCDVANEVAREILRDYESRIDVTKSIKRIAYTICIASNWSHRGGALKPLGTWEADTALEVADLVQAAKQQKERTHLQQWKTRAQQEFKISPLIIRPEDAIFNAVLASHPIVCDLAEEFRDTRTELQELIRALRAAHARSRETPSEMSERSQEIRSPT